MHTYTAALRAAAADEASCPQAMAVWSDMLRAGCQPTGAQMFCSLQLDLACVRASCDYQRLGLLKLVACLIRLQSQLAASEPQYLTGVPATGHAFAAAISACGVGGRWQEANALFSDMLEAGVSADVVSCTALASALAAGGQWQRCRQLLDWMPSVSRQLCMLVSSTADVGPIIHQISVQVAKA